MRIALDARRAAELAHGWERRLVEEAALARVIAPPAPAPQPLLG
jgi:hypothetical protein